MLLFAAVTVQKTERHQNLLYEEENEHVHSSFNSQTPVPRLISRLGEREGNAMLNEKKREERKNPLPFIWYGNISCSHTHCGDENKQLGDMSEEEERKLREMNSDVFSEREVVKEARVGR